MSACPASHPTTRPNTHTHHRYHMSSSHTPLLTKLQRVAGCRPPTAYKSRRGVCAQQHRTAPAGARVQHMRAVRLSPAPTSSPALPHMYTPCVACSNTQAGCSRAEPSCCCRIPYTPKPCSHASTRGHQPPIPSHHKTAALTLHQFLEQATPALHTQQRRNKPA